ncbi:glucose-1-phosphatase [Klebsiella pneumoniae]|uniref:Glucose-1-phosphatase n=1 Tax=Klebsiella pneumoniae TaxID=573 RepID=A0A4P0Y3Q0_KLEPN|nr:glucose-1-phosphatase [Klebsiella pneumoniae]
MQLTESYKLLETMIDYRNSPSCKEKKVCSLSEGKDTFSAGYQQEPGVSGPVEGGQLAGRRLHPAIL